MILKPDRKLWTPPRSVVMPRSWWRQRGFFVPMPLHKPYKVDAADFDGANDYMTRGAGLTGAADSKTGIFSCCARIDGGDGSLRNIFTAVTTVAGGTIRFSVDMLTGNGIEVVGRNSAGTVILNMISFAHAAGATWLNLLMSWNMGVGGAAHIYTNDASDKQFTPTFTDDTIDYTLADWAIGAVANGGAKYNGCLVELYFAPGQYLDFSVEANRRKFITAKGKPAKLGTDGSLPTGTAPLSYHTLKHGEAAANFATNRGTGGNLTITGTLDTASTSPSD